MTVLLLGLVIMLAVSGVIGCLIHHDTTGGNE